MRIALTLALVLISLLSVFQPPTNFFWMMASVVQEAGHFLAPACLLVLWWNARNGFLGRAGVALLFLATFLFLSPLMRAMVTGHRLQKEFEVGFGKTLAQSEGYQRLAPIQWKQLFLGIPASHSSPKTMLYTNLHQEKFALDFYPTAQPKAPCIVIVHGGGWDSGDRTNLDPLNHYLSDLGYAVATVDYGLSPEHLYPTPVEDVESAIRFLQEHGSELGIDIARIVLLGRSAGGQIALQVAYSPNKIPGIVGVVAYYAPADMVYGYHAPCNPRILDSRKLMEKYLGRKYSEDPAAYRASSPIEALTTKAPPTLLLHGIPDVLVAYEHTRRMEVKLTKLGVPHFTVDLPWATHGFDYIFSGPGSQVGLYFLERFLLKVTKSH